MSLAASSLSRRRPKFWRAWPSILPSSLARPGDAALDRADRTAANLGGLLVGEAADCYQNQGFALFVGEQMEGTHDFR